MNMLETNSQTVPSKNLKVAEARFRQARALIGFFRAGLFPMVYGRSWGKLAARFDECTQRVVEREASTRDFLLTGDVSYELDLWGRIRRSVTAAREEAQATAADLETAKLSLQAELAIDYFELRSADAQQRLLNDTVKAFDEALQLTIQSIRRRRCAEVGCGTGADSTGDDASAGHGYRRAAGAVRACHRRFDWQSPLPPLAFPQRHWISSHRIFRWVSLQSFWSDGRTSRPRSVASPRRTSRSASPRRPSFRR